MAKSKLTKRNIKHQEEEDNWSDQSVNGDVVTTKRKKASGAGKAAKRAKLTSKNIKKLEEESDWSDESANGDASSSSQSSSSEESSKSSAQSSSGSEESEGSDLDYNPNRDDDVFSDDQMLSDSDNEDAESNKSDQASSMSETEPESSADEEEIVSSSSSEGEENDASSEEEEEEELMPLTTADLDNNDKVDIKMPSLPGSDGQEVQAAIERSVAAALQIAENVHSNVVEAVQAVILEDDNADYVPDEFISYAGPKRKSVRLKNVQKKPAIVDYSSDEDEVKELLKIEKEVERNLREAEKLKKQNSKKKKKKSKPKKTIKKKKPTKQESSDDEHDFEESVNESSGSEFEP